MLEDSPTDGPSTEVVVDVGVAVVVETNGYSSGANHILSERPNCSSSEAADDEDDKNVDRSSDLGYPKPKHPSEYLDKLEFLNSAVDLMTHETFKKTQADRKKIERRRRTTANPKYNSSNGFIDPSVALNLRRTRKNDDFEFGYIKPKKRTTSGQKTKNIIISCFVCEQQGCNLTCGNCSTKYHSDCIRVGGSKAPLVTRVEVCPNCIQQIQQQSRQKLDSSSLDSSSLVGSSNSLPLPNKLLNEMKSNNNIRLINLINNKRPNNLGKKSNFNFQSLKSKLKSNLHSTSTSSSTTSSKILKKIKKKKKSVVHRDLITGEIINKSTYGTDNSPSYNPIKGSPTGTGKSSRSSSSGYASASSGSMCNGLGNRAFVQDKPLSEADLKKTIISMTEAAKYVLESSNTTIMNGLSRIYSPVHLPAAPKAPAPVLLPPPSTTSTSTPALLSPLSATINSTAALLPPLSTTINSTAALLPPPSTTFTPINHTETETEELQLEPSNAEVHLEVMVSPSSPNLQLTSASSPNLQLTSDPSPAINSFTVSSDPAPTLTPTPAIQLPFI